jgi:hypothetical protein
MDWKEQARHRDLYCSCNRASGFFNTYARSCVSVYSLSLRAATDPVSVAAEARCALLIVRYLRPDRLLQSTALLDTVYTARSSSVAMGSREVHTGSHQKTRKCRPGKHPLGCPYQ